MAGRRKQRATFTTDSRSTSRDRFDLEAARSAAGARTGSFNAHLPTIVAVPQSIIDEQEQAGTLAEVEPLLGPDEPPSTPARNGGGASLYRVSSIYGSFNEQGSPHYLQLARPPGRNDSILKLSGMIDNRGGELEKYRMSEEQMKGMKRNVKAFYRAQNDILDGFAEVDEILDSTRAMAVHSESSPIIPAKPSAGREEALGIQVKLAINVNFFILDLSRIHPSLLHSHDSFYLRLLAPPSLSALRSSPFSRKSSHYHANVLDLQNFLLLGAKIAIVLLSNSMSLIASTVDSALDFLSTLIIFGTSRVIEHRSWQSVYLYPTGKRRMEPVGILVFSVFMIASFLQVFVESMQRLLNKDLEQARIPPLGIWVMLATIVIKAVVWVWCRAIKNSSVEALAQDAENDIVFNTFSLLFPYIGDRLGWRYLDPLGGALLSVYIMIEWTRTLLENVQKLTGKRASPQQHQRVAYLLTRFSPLITGIQHLSVYHTGDSYIVEADVVLPSTTDLTLAHNMAESAQYGLESLAGIERAFVHIDVTVNPLSGHVPR